MRREVVSIVVLVRDRLSTFEACLTALYANTRSAFHVIAIVGRVDCDTRRLLADIADRRGNLQFVEREHILTEHEARRIGLAFVRTRWCVFMENDTIVHPGWLETMFDAALAENAAVVMPLILWHRGIHAAGCYFSKRDALGTDVLEHCIVYTDLRRKEIGYCETHCLLIDLEQVTHDELCQDVEPSDVDLGLALAGTARVLVFEPAAVVSYAAPPPMQLRDIEHSLQRWNLQRWLDAHERFLRKWNVRYDATAKRRSYRRQELRLALVRRVRRPWAIVVTNAVTHVLNAATTTLTSSRRLRSFG